MSRRTSPIAVLVRFWVVAFVLSLPIGIPAVIVGAISLPFLAFIALGVTIFFNGFQWLGLRLLFGHTEEYKQYRKNGGDPWFNLACPPPFNTDSEEVRLSGSEQPAPRWICRNCGAEMADPDAPCPVCEYGLWACGRCGELVTGQFARCSGCGNQPEARRGTP